MRLEMESSFVADSDLIKALERRAVSLPCWCGLMLFRQGEHPTGVYVIRTGEVTLLLTDDNGNEVTYFDVGAGSILGLPAILAKEPYSLSAMARGCSNVALLNFPHLKSY